VGGPAVLSLLGRGGNTHTHTHTQTNTLLLAVEENETLMKAQADDLFPPHTQAGAKVIRVKTYLEAMGILACHKAGINPAALTPNVPRINRLA
jgi:hypothetical protein